MVNTWDKIFKGLAAFGGAVAGVFGGLDTALIVLVAFMAIDYATGLVVAWMGRSSKTKNGKLDSNVGFIGIAKKVLMLMLVLVAALLDRALGTDTAVFRSLVIWFYIANEALSILENLSTAGVPFPQKLREALEKLHDQNDGGEDER